MFASASLLHRVQSWSLCVAHHGDLLAGQAGEDDLQPAGPRRRPSRRPVATRWAAAGVRRHQPEPDPAEHGQLDGLQHAEVGLCGLGPVA